MRGFRFPAAVLAAIAAPLLLGAAAQPGSQFSAERFKAHVTFLADDMLEGRETGTRGHELAARYVASQMDLLGLTPAGEDGSWFQQVQLAETSLADPDPSMTVTGPGEVKSFGAASGVIIRGPVGGGVVDLTAPVVFVGYGVTDPGSGGDDYRNVDVRGKIVLMVRAAPPSLDSEISAHLRADQARNAVRHGAVGVIQFLTRSGARQNSTADLAAEAQRPSSNWVNKEGAPQGGATALKVQITADHAAVANLLQGSPQTLEQILDAVTAGRRPQAFELPATVHVKVATKARRYTSPEVIGLIKGSDPVLRDEYVVLMAHLDHLGMRPGRPDPIFNGALDNAAGVATLLEVARAVKSQPKPPKRSVLVIANTGEEKGLLGADYFANHPTVPADKIVAAVDLDMPVLTYSFADVIAYGGAHSTMAKSIARAANAMGVKLAKDPMPEQAVFVRSDHYPLARSGVPAVMLATGYANGGEDAWTRFFATNYHRPSDDLNQPIRWVDGARFAELNYRVVRELADQRERPRWYAGDYFGDLFAPGQAKAKR